MKVALSLKQMVVGGLSIFGGLFVAGWLVSQAVNEAQAALESASRDGIEAVREEFQPLKTDVALMRQSLERTASDIADLKKDGDGYVRRDVFETWRGTIDSRLSGVESRVSALEKDRQ